MDGPDSKKERTRRGGSSSGGAAFWLVRPSFQLVWGVR